MNFKSNEKKVYNYYDCDEVCVVIFIFYTNKFEFNQILRLNKFANICVKHIHIHYIHIQTQFANTLIFCVF